MGRRIFHAPEMPGGAGRECVEPFLDMFPASRRKNVCKSACTCTHSHTQDPCLHRYTGTYTCMHTGVYAHRRSTRAHCSVTESQVKTQVLTALTHSTSCAIFPKQRGAHGGATGRGRLPRGSSQTQPTVGQGLCHQDPSKLPRAGQCPLPARPKAACSGSNSWASDSGEGRISKHYTSSQSC